MIDSHETTQKPHYELIKTKRKTLQIVVKKDLRVIVSAPLAMSAEKINDFVIKRTRWIEKQKLFYQQLGPHTVKRYCDGEEHAYLGKQFPLHIAQGSKAKIEFDSTRFIITQKNAASPQKTKELLITWYKKEAQKIFGERLNQYACLFPECKNTQLYLRIRRMKARWGSMAQQRLVTLNLDLIKTPIECIDYVIVHELCHIKHPNHSRAYYAKLEKYMPDYKNRKRILEAFPL